MGIIIGLESTLTTAFNSLKSFIENILKERLDKLSSDITEIKRMLLNNLGTSNNNPNQINEIITNYEKELKIKNDEILKLQKDINNLQSGKSKSTFDVNQKDDLLKEKDAEIKKINQNNSELIQKIEKLNKSAKDFENDIKLLKDEKISLNSIIEKLNKSIKDYENEVKLLKDEKTSLSITIDNFKKKCNDLEKKNSEIQSETEKYKKEILKLNQINEIMNNYKTILEKVINCKSLEKFNENYKLTNNTEDFGNYEKIIKLLGEEYYLAKEIQLAIEKEKIISLIPITNDEKELYNELNNYYKNNKGIAFDVIYFPKPEKFEKSIMKDIKEPRGDFNKWVEIYIPAIQEREGTFTFKALVKGSK